MYSNFKKDDKVFQNNFALGNKIENKEFNITEQQIFIRDLIQAKNGLKIGINDTTHVTSKEMVKVLTLDQYCNEKNK